MKNNLIIVLERVENIAGNAKRKKIYLPAFFILYIFFKDFFFSLSVVKTLDCVVKSPTIENMVEREENAD